MDPAPLILRRMPLPRQPLAHAMTGLAGAPAPGTWWELVDAASAADLPPVAVALTRAGADASVTVAALAFDGLPELADLLRALTAALRGHGVDLMIADPADPAVVPSLVAVGFSRVGDRYVLLL
jgi:hypothetical protein